jgi:glycolate oxidase FAD binding subunit
MTLLIPADESQVADAIRDANAEGSSLTITGAGSKKPLGRCASAEHTLSLRSLTGVTLYEPSELVVSARAATPLADIEAMLSKHGQQFGFEPMDYGPLLGVAPGAASIGATVAVNASGPRRIKAGAARDHLLGFRCVTGRGDSVKSGGRVMKNVTGFDLSKLVCGSYGTLAALTEVTFKVLPKAETEETILVSGLNESEALSVLRQASMTACEASSFAMLPGGVTPGGADMAAIRLEGPAISVASRRDDLHASIARPGARVDKLAGDDSRALWRQLRDVAPIVGVAGQVWRVSVAPTDACAVVEGLRRAGVPLLAHYYDWAGGLIWLCVDAAPDAHAAIIRAEVDAVGGHATLIRASGEARAQVDVFHPQPAALAALSQRVKDSFDPAHILERGRMRAEF